MATVQKQPKNTIIVKREKICANGEPAVDGKCYTIVDKPRVKPVVKREKICANGKPAVDGKCYTIVKRENAAVRGV